MKYNYYVIDTIDDKVTNYKSKKKFLDSFEYNLEVAIQNHDLTREEALEKYNRFIDFKGLYCDVLCNGFIYCKETL